MKFGRSSPIHLRVAADLRQHRSACAKESQRALVPCPRAQLHEVGARSIRDVRHVLPAIDAAYAVTSGQSQLRNRLQAIC